MQLTASICILDISHARISLPKSGILRAMLCIAAVGRGRGLMVLFWAGVDTVDRCLTIRLICVVSDLCPTVGPS